VRGTNVVAPHYVVFSTPQLPPPSQGQYLPQQHPILKHPQPMFIPDSDGPRSTSK